MHSDGTEAVNGVFVSASVAASLLGVTGRAVRKAIAGGRYISKVEIGKNGPELHVSVASLPEAARMRYLIGLLRDLPENERGAEVARWTLGEKAVRRAPKATPIPFDPPPSTWTQEEHDRLDAEFRALPANTQEMAGERYRVLVKFEAYRRAHANGRGANAIMQRWCQEQGHTLSTVKRWREMVKGVDKRNWLFALAPKYGRHGAPKSEIHPDLWAWIIQQWGIQSKPALKPIYREAVEIAMREGWETCTYQTVRTRINALPHATKELMRGGEDALEATFPTMRRDYESLEVNELWNADGRMADVHCRWPDDTVSRPIVVAWFDLRTRMVMGWAIDKSENAYMVQMAFLDAMNRSDALPLEVYLDNGRAFASKQMTGGTVARNRFKVDPDEVYGVFTMMGVKTTFTKPYNGKAKPIESFWNNPARMEKRAIFRGAYCGNRPGNRPEEHAMENAIPIETYQAEFARMVEEYHQRAHTGHGMNGRSPMEVYTELVQTAIVRKPTAQALQACAQVAQKVTVRSDGGIYILENRYSCDAMAQLPRGSSYTARYDPQDASEPIHLYDGDRFLFTVPLVYGSGFQDKQAAQDHARAKNRHKRAVREEARAIKEMETSRDWMAPRNPVTVDPDTGEILPRAKVLRPVKPAKGRGTKAAPVVAPAGDGDLTPEEFRAALARGEAMRYGT